MITVVDYGAGNLRSVENALKYLEIPHAITSQAEDVASASAILLPGVGHFGQMMRSLQLLGLTSVLRESVCKGTPYLGICLGLHALYERSDEAPAWPGLGILRGSVRRLPEGLKVPHMGWNQLEVAPESRLLDGIGAGPFVYFAHSYYLPMGESPSRDERTHRVVASSEYGSRFVAAVEAGNTFGVQFHPEKSSDIGLRILANFAQVCQKTSTGQPTKRGGKRAG